MLLEACVSIMLVGLGLAVVSCLHELPAAPGERMRAGALQVGDSVFVDDAGITCDIQVSDAEGDWAPLRRVHVRTEVTGRHGRRSRYELMTFVVQAPRGGEGEE